MLTLFCLRSDLFPLVEFQCLLDSGSIPPLISSVPAASGFPVRNGYIHSWNKAAVEIVRGDGRPGNSTFHQLRDEPLCLLFLLFNVLAVIPYGRCLFSCSGRLWHIPPLLSSPCWPSPFALSALLLPV